MDSSGSSNAEVIKTIFKSLGYLLLDVILDARDHGVPHRRTRWWALGVRLSFEPLTDVVEASQTDAVNRFYQTLGDIKLEMAPLDILLMPEGSPLLQEWTDRMLAIRHSEVEPVGGEEVIEESPDRGHANWPDMHAYLFVPMASAILRAMPSCTRQRKSRSFAFCLLAARRSFTFSTPTTAGPRRRTSLMFPSRSFVYQGWQRRCLAFVPVACPGSARGSGA